MLRIAHNVAQFSHCAAQGKVGSGFDVSTAFFGSQKYTRFDPKLLAPLLEIPDPDGVTICKYVCNEEERKGERERESEVVPSDNWDFKTEEFSLPPMMYLVLADVKGGSETPSMVRKVLQFGKEHPESM